MSPFNFQEHVLHINSGHNLWSIYIYIYIYVYIHLWPDGRLLMHVICPALNIWLRLQMWRFSSQIVLITNIKKQSRKTETDPPPQEVLYNTAGAATEKLARKKPNILLVEYTDNGQNSPTGRS